MFTFTLLSGHWMVFAGGQNFGDRRGSDCSGRASPGFIYENEGMRSQEKLEWSG